MPKKHQQFIEASVEDLLHLLEKNPEVEGIVGRFRLTAVLGFLIEMTEVYPIDESHKQRMIEVRNALTQSLGQPLLTSLN